MNGHQRPTPEAIAEAAWRHLINRHDLNQALDELEASVDPDTLSAIASQLRSHRHGLIQAVTERCQPQSDDQQSLRTTGHPTRPQLSGPPHGDCAPVPSTTSRAR